MGVYLELLAQHPALAGTPHLTKETNLTKEAHLISFTSFNSYPDRLKALASEAIQGLTGYITPARLLAKCAPEDIAELARATDPLPFLRSFAIACVWTDFRRQGVAPPDWTYPAHCDQCGNVYLWASIDVAGCPWCWNRLYGVKIPRPDEKTASPIGAGAAISTEVLPGHGGAP